MLSIIIGTCPFAAVDWLVRFERAVPRLVNSKFFGLGCGPPSHDPEHFEQAVRHRIIEGK